MIELKVLYKGGPEPVGWSLSGVEQAAKYRREETDVCFACIFDALVKKLEYPQVAKHAELHKVRLERYLMDLPIEKQKKARGKKAGSAR
jgi:hypothetical protein